MFLPYKLKDESPEDFRSYFMHRYSWIPDSLKNKHDAREVINLVNNDLRNGFILQSSMLRLIYLLMIF